MPGPLPDKIARIFGLDADEFVPVRGLDTASRVWRNSEIAIKITAVSGEEATELRDKLVAIHGALAPHCLAPQLKEAHLLDDNLVTAYSLASGGRVTIEQAGTALASAHQILATLDVEFPTSWIGAVGEAEDFDAVMDNVGDDEIRRCAAALLPKAYRQPVNKREQIVHRDYHDRNAILHNTDVWILDWDMAHTGAKIDDIAMSICMQCDPWPVDQARICSNDFLAGYRATGGQLDEDELVAAIAIAGLRQGVGGWITDGGDTEAPYWPHIRHRMKVAEFLV